jgi:translation elongation factor EF-Ts
MPDDKTKIGGLDRERVSAEEEYEIKYLREKTGASREQILEAIRRVGHNREDVMNYLKSK